MAVSAPLRSALPFAQVDFKLRATEAALSGRPLHVREMLEDEDAGMPCAAPASFASGGLLFLDQDTKVGWRRLSNLSWTSSMPGWSSTYYPNSSSSPFVGRSSIAKHLLPAQGVAQESAGRGGGGRGGGVERPHAAPPTPATPRIESGGARGKRVERRAVPRQHLAAIVRVKFI